MVEQQSMYIPEEIIERIGYFCDRFTLKRLSCCSRTYRYVLYSMIARSMRRIKIEYKNSDMLYLLSSFTNLRKLNIYADYEINNESLSYIANLTTLTDLRLSNWLQISNKGLIHLAKLVNLTSLDLCFTKVTNKGIVFISTTLINLVYLNLDLCDVNLKGLCHLRKLKRLRELRILRVLERSPRYESDDEIDHDSISRLKSMLPRVNVIWNIRTL